MNFKDKGVWIKAALIGLTDRPKEQKHINAIGICPNMG
jgi:hypothetical protein